jgi:hypothetical protein
MTLAWFLTLGTPTLRRSLASLSFVRLFPTWREAIAQELATRAWCDHVEATYERTISWCRGGRS